MRRQRIFFLKGHLLCLMGSVCLFYFRDRFPHWDLGFIKEARLAGQQAQGFASLSVLGLQACVMPTFAHVFWGSTPILIVARQALHRLSHTSLPAPSPVPHHWTLVLHFLCLWPRQACLWDPWLFHCIQDLPFLPCVSWTLHLKAWWSLGEAPYLSLLLQC